jgi:hypothetical protein
MAIRVDGRRCKARRDQDHIKAVQDKDRKAWFADSRFSSARDHRVLVGPRDRVRHTKADQANNVEARIQQALQGQVDIRRAQEWGV